MLVVQPLSFDSGDEELGTICVRPRVGHREEAGGPVLHQEVFIIERSTINTFSASSIKIFKVTSLFIEFVNNS